MASKKPLSRKRRVFPRSIPGAAFLLLPIGLAFYNYSFYHYQSQLQLSFHGDGNGKDKGLMDMDRTLLPPLQRNKPEIVWLMSYPNSGTSYTMTLVERASERSTATNYGVEVTDKQDASLPVHPNHPEGPYWEGLSGKLGTVRHLPTKYVLTKTHCSGRCVNCGANEYVVSTEKFLQGCARTSARVSTGKRRVESTMSANRVVKMVHLIRNPYANIVARFHLERRHLMEKQPHLQTVIPNNASGFRAWCRMLNDEYGDSERATFSSLWAIAETVPCRGEFYKWTQWHNRAHDIVPLIGKNSGSGSGSRSTAGSAIHTIHYEDYQDNFNATVAGIMDFLQLPVQGKIRPFRALPDYADHFSDKDRAAIKNMVQAVASDHTWDLVQRYF